jgi:hypothetical protein
MHQEKIFRSMDFQTVYILGHLYVNLDGLLPDSPSRLSFGRAS